MIRAWTMETGEYYLCRTHDMADTRLNTSGSIRSPSEEACSVIRMLASPRCGLQANCSWWQQETEENTIIPILQPFWWYYFKYLEAGKLNEIKAHCSQMIFEKSFEGKLPVEMSQKPIVASKWGVLVELFVIWDTWKLVKLGENSEQQFEGNEPACDQWSLSRPDKKLEEWTFSGSLLGDLKAIRLWPELCLLSNCDLHEIRIS